MSVNANKDHIRQQSKIRQNPSQTQIGEGEDDNAGKRPRYGETLQREKLRLGSPETRALCR